MKFCDRRRVAEAQARRCLQQEMSVLKRLTGHSNIVQLFEVIETATHVVLVMEFGSGGDLLRYVRQRRKLEDSQAQDIFKQLLDGIQHIHSVHVVHRDIKLENLLLDACTCLKIADFGVAVVVKPPGRRLTEHCGTPSYMAPEILLEAGYEGQPVDLWSAGVVLYAMLCGRVPFKGDHPTELRRAVLRGRFYLPPELGHKAAAMLLGLLVVDPSQRFATSEALAHGWLEGVGNRAFALYGAPWPSHILEEEDSAGSTRLPQSLLSDPSVQAALSHATQLGFQLEQVEQSLRAGKLTPSSAAFHLLRQRALRQNAAAAQAAQAAAQAAQAPPQLTQTIELEGVI